MKEEKEDLVFFIAGVGHYNLHKVIKEISFGDELDIEQEPTNLFDPNAIKVHFFSPIRGEYVHIGYVPAKLCEQVNSLLLSFDSTARCSVIGIYPNNADFRKLKVKVFPQEIGKNNES